jgi:signal transduction histidine kinase
MTLKRQVAINVAVAFSILFGLAAGVIYYSFASFRKEEFKDRLEEKALTTAKLLLEVKELDNQLLKLIDQNTINKLYNEKTLVFDDKLRLIYSSIDDASIRWDETDLKRLKRTKKFFTQGKDLDLFGIFYDFEKNDYYVLIAAEDKYGNSKLVFLRYSLILTFLGSTGLVWLFTSIFIKKLLRPLDEFQQQITSISGNALNVQLQESGKNDEIELLTKAFNQMLLRIESAFDSQREFTSNASHELRTPLSRMAFQTENLLQKDQYPAEIAAYLRSMHEDIHQLSDLVNSLLLLSKFSKQGNTQPLKPERVDEIIFDVVAKIKKVEPQFDFDFEIIEDKNSETTLEIQGIRSLLEIAFSNLLKNAYLYSTNKKVRLALEQPNTQELHIYIRNQGNPLIEKEQKRLFEPFFRGKNAQGTHGSGLGLRIVKRILDYHEANIKYSFLADQYNQFELIFKTKPIY